MKQIDTSTNVLVFPSEDYGSLGIMRTLGRLGVSVYGINHSPDTSSFASKYCRESFIWDFDNANEEDSVQYLLDVGRKIGSRTLLIPVGDRFAQLVADHAETLRTCFIFPDQSAQLVESLSDKNKMFELATKHGVATAYTVYPKSRKDVEQYVEEKGFPIMIKGVDGIRLEMQTGIRMLIVQNEKELFDFYDNLKGDALSNIVLQEYIPGGEDTIWIFDGYFNESSDCLAGFTGKKMRQAPVYTGMTSLGICLENEEVRQTTIRFMKEIGYKGVLDLGYRYDARDGSYKILDINPRVGVSFRLFVDHNGMDVIRALYLDMTGQKVPEAIQPNGRKWIVEDKDLLSCYNYFRDGNISFTKWLTSFKGVQEAGYFALDDMGPFWKMCKSHLARFKLTGSKKSSKSKAIKVTPAIDKNSIHLPQTFNAES